MTETLTGDPSVSEDPPSLPQPGKLVRFVGFQGFGNGKLSADLVGLVVSHDEKWNTAQVLWSANTRGWYNPWELEEV